MTRPITQGVHHIGLTVSSLEDSAAFYTAILGWQEVRRDDSYPAIFVSDGTTMITLWQNRETPAVAFNKNTNIGLHHIALLVASEAELHNLYEKLLQNKIDIEFSPELLRQGPAKHMMCYEPSGVRVEFIWPGNQ